LPWWEKRPSEVHALRARRENTEKVPTTLKLARQWTLGLTH